jgi:hypothetical protein
MCYSSLGAVWKFLRDVMMSERRHLMVVAPRPTDDEHRVASGFDPPKKWTGWLDGATSIHHGDPNISTVLSLAKERDRQKEKYQHRMITDGLAFVFTVALMAAGIWPPFNIHGLSLHPPLSGPP